MSDLKGIVGINEKSIKLLDSRGVSDPKSFLEFTDVPENKAVLADAGGVSTGTVEIWVKEAELMDLGIDAKVASEMVAIGYDRETVKSSAEKLQVVKATKEKTGLGLKEAKEVIDLVTAAPTRAKVEITKNRFLEKLAPVEIRQIENTTLSQVQRPTISDSFVSNIEGRPGRDEIQFEPIPSPLLEVARLEKHKYLTDFKDFRIKYFANGNLKPITGLEFEKRDPMDTIQMTDGTVVSLPTVSDVNLDLMILEAELKLAKQSKAGISSLEVLHHALCAEREHRDDEGSQEHSSDILLADVKHCIEEYNSNIPRTIDTVRLREARERSLEHARMCLRELAYRGYQLIAESDSDDDLTNNLSPWAGNAGTEFFESLEDALGNIKVVTEFNVTSVKGTLTYDIVGLDPPLRNASVEFKWAGKTTAKDKFVTGQDGKFEVEIPKEVGPTALIISVKKASIVEDLAYTAEKLMDLKGDLGIVKLKKDFSKVEGIFEKLDNATKEMEAVANMEGERAAEKAELKEVQEPPKIILGEGEGKFALTASISPSIHSYGILHRLVEPNMVKNVGDSKEFVGRETVGPIDISKFRENMIRSPLAQPLMASVGVGYILSMQQEWKPTKFSLGDLLYSVALAPGEEHRVIMTEKSERYGISDIESFSESESERYASSQSDNTSAIFRSAMYEQMDAYSHMESKTKSAGGGLLTSLWGTASKTTTTASSNASQTNRRDEASRMSNRFNESIARSARNQRTSSRVGIRTATSRETLGVTSKILANHNHSHALTMQYWEVVRNYSITTRVNDVKLVCYVPFKPIAFMPSGQKQILDFNDAAAKMKPGNAAVKFTTDVVRELFEKRYSEVLKHYDSLYSQMPYKYRGGLALMKKYATYPEWDFLGVNPSGPTRLQLRVKGGFLSWHRVSAQINLKNYKGKLVAHQTRVLGEENHDCTTKYALKEFLRDEKDSLKTLTFEFQIPPGLRDDDFGNLELSLSLPDEAQFTLEHTEKEKIKLWLTDVFASQKALDKLDFSIDKNNEVVFSRREIQAIGAPTVSEVTLTKSGSKSVTYLEDYDSLTLSSRLRYTIYDSMPTMSFEELQQIETAFQHIVENPIRYSQAVWAGVSAEERAMLLENYTMAATNALGTDLGMNIPLTDCVANQVEGFYGNCMILPFAYPPKVANALGTSNKELQDALYRYHMETFLAPDMSIAIGTGGMIGEAVLGGSNASEKIDITRFWNWQDSPITSATNIGMDDLDKTSLLAGKDAPSALTGLEGGFTLDDIKATKMNSMIKHLAAEKRAFEDLTNGQNVAKHMTAVAENAINERMNSLNTAASVLAEAVGIKDTSAKPKDAAAGSEGSSEGGSGGGSGSGGGQGGGGRGSGSGNGGKDQNPSGQNPAAPAADTPPKAEETPQEPAPVEPAPAADNPAPAEETPQQEGGQ